MWKGFLLLFLGLSHSAHALPERNVSFGVGFGPPEIVSAQGQVMVSQRWQLGLGYTYIPAVGPIGKPQDLPAQNVRLADGNDYAIIPTITPNINFLSPFLRFYPDKNNFYVQFMYSLFQMKGTVSAGFEDTTLSQLLPGALVGGEVTLTQTVPTVSLGYVFSSRLFYVNFSIGVSWIGSISADVDLATTLPDSVGGSSSNQATIAQITEEIQTSAQQAVEEARSQLRVVPSLYLSFGFFL